MLEDPPRPNVYSTPITHSSFAAPIALARRAGTGFSGAYNTVKRFVVKLRGSKQPEAVGIIFTGRGEEAQVDHGEGPMARDPQTSKYRRTRLFVMTLGYSQKANNR